MTHAALTTPQLELLFHAGIFGLCRIPADAVEDVSALREAGLVTLNEERCFELTRAGAARVAALGGYLSPRATALH